MEYFAYFQCNIAYENINDIMTYVRLIFTFRKTERSNISPEVLNRFERFRIGNRPNIYNLYQLYFSVYVYGRENLQIAGKPGLQRTLQQYYINSAYLINQITNEFYDEEFLEGIEFHGATIPPKIREIRIQPAEGSHQARSRRRQREGGNGSGSNRAAARPRLGGNGSGGNGGGGN
uniref:Uncharacterized protein n=1 Tax=Meloidogyne hapla TaxID=6305 RepID=A0A1I8BJF1_MELHA